MYKPRGLALRHSLPLAKPYFPKCPQPVKTEAAAGDQFPNAWACVGQYTLKPQQYSPVRKNG